MATPSLQDGGGAMLTKKELAQDCRLHSSMQMYANALLWWRIRRKTASRCTLDEFIKREMKQNFTPGVPPVIAALQQLCLGIRRS
uniref:Uncharacterized protein n=1 Tax=Knipowitschia caucasica TaxID=637954 RepID=A0AAV2K0F7_KNICA